MTREEFINKILPYCANNDEASQIANDYTDDELAERGDEIVKELDEDYRYNANVEHYRNYGW